MRRFWFPIWLVVGMGCGSGGLKTNQGPTNTALDALLSNSPIQDSSEKLLPNGDPLPDNNTEIVIQASSENNSLRLAVDHASIIDDWDENSYARGKSIYHDH